MPELPDEPEDVAAWKGSDPPRSREHGDIYFSAEDGLAEARAVFLAGCDLPDAWAGRRRFCVAELGFGTGLNIAALLELWVRTRPVGGRLHVFTIERTPLTAREAARALGLWPELTEVTRVLLAQWPPSTPGFHRIELAQWGVLIDVAHMEAAEALRAWSGAADAWFLDGFSPALDPAIWRQEVIGLVAARSAPGARAASFTVAGHVRRSLSAAGFAVERRPGHGRKRERLEARAAGTVREGPPPSVAIVGAGIAGASLARAFGALGMQAQVFDLGRAGAGASGAPGVLTTPRLDAGLGLSAQLFAQTLERAHALYAAVPGAVLAEGVVQLGRDPRDAGRFAKIARSDLFGPGGATAADAAAGVEASTLASLTIRQAQAIDPSAALEAWLPPIRRDRAIDVAADGRAWRLTLDGGGEARFDVVCIAAGPASAELAPGLPLSPVRGQATVVEGPDAPAVSFGGYLAPTRAGAVFGATHGRGEADLEPRAADAEENLRRLQAALPGLARRLAEAPARAFVGVRAVSPDSLPLAGPAGAQGLHVLCGLGSRGFCLAPLLGEHVAALAVGAPSPLRADLAALVDPLRFGVERAKARLDGSQARPPPFRQGSGRPA